MSDRGFKQVFDAGTGLVAKAARVNIFFEVVVEFLGGFVEKFRLLEVAHARFTSDEVQFHHKLLTQRQFSVKRSRDDLCDLLARR